MPTMCPVGMIGFLSSMTACAASSTRSNASRWSNSCRDIQRPTRRKGGGVINLVSRHPNSIAALVGQKHYRKHCGLFTGPRSRFRPESALALGAAWAADNDCYQRYDPASILRMLHAYRGLPKCLFVVVPDVVGNAIETTLLFQSWIGTYQRLGYPAAYVAQNGVEAVRVPWDSFGTLFIGGTTPFKFSRVVYDLVQEARQRGKHVHNGRVNTARRVKYSHAIGCDSFDGTGYTIEPRRVKQHLQFLENKQELLIA